MTVRAGLCSISMRALSPDEIVECAVGAGLTGVEWGGDAHIPPGATAIAERVARRCADAGLECVSYGSYLRAGTTTAAEIDPVLDAAQALGAPNVRIWCQHGVTPDASERDRDRVVEGVAEITAQAATRGLTTSLEFHVDTLTHTAASALQILDAVDHPTLFTYWQPDWTLSRDALVAEFAAVRGRISHVHACTWRSYEHRLPLADGAPMWQDVLRSVDAPGAWARPRYVFIEHVVDDAPDQLTRDAATLRSWLGLA